MKTAIVLLGTTLWAASVTTASARCVGPVVNGQCLGAEVGG